MLSTAIISDVEKRLSELLGKSMRVNASVPVGGGSINETFRLDTTEGPFFIKTNSASAFPGMFEAEAKGLELLKKNTALYVPEVLLCGECDDRAYVLMEFTPAGKRTRDFWELFGKGIAGLHRRSNKQFGLDHPNYIGSLPQDNSFNDSWSEFFITCRLEPMIRLGNTDKEVNRRFGRLFSKLENIFPTEPPALLHGDLWSGNFGTAGNGQPFIFDPAVYYGHREMDIGMSKLFGGFDMAFYEAYNEHFPMEKGWQERVDIANLYPLMVHVNLFGGSYLESVRRILKPFA